MKEYVVTELAGPSVAGQRNPGAGETLVLKESAAEHPLRLGHLKPVAAFDPLDRDFDGRKGGSRRRRK